jgi:hypothetical protein
MPDNIIKFVVITLLVISTGAIADTQKEIEHLLKFVANTSCKYERNGTLHAGTKAKNHIQKKYNYFLDKVNTAEDFIKYSATKSTMSGKIYKIHCTNMPVQNSADWLLDELKKFRRSQSE